MDGILSAAIVVGALVLAGVVWRLARNGEQIASAARNVAEATQRLADAADAQQRATRDRAEVARQALNASIQPLMRDAPQRSHSGDNETGDAACIEVRQDDGFVSLGITFVNIGPGVALVRRAEVNHTFDRRWPADRITSTMVAPGQWTRLTFALPVDQPELAELIEQVQRGRFFVSVRYTNALGTEPTVTRVQVRRDEQQPGLHYRVGTVFLLRSSEAQLDEEAAEDLSC